MGAEEGDEVEMSFDDGATRRVLIESVEKAPTHIEQTAGTAQAPVTL